MRQRQEYKTPESIAGDSNKGICLFEDYAVLQKDTYSVAQVVRMVHKSQEYCKPVLFDDPSIPSITIHTSEYKRTNTSDSFIYFSKMESSVITLEAKKVLTHVHLSIDTSSGEYYMSLEDDKTLQEQVKKLTKPREKQPVRNKDLADDGRRTVIVEAKTMANASQVRKSTRKRKLIVSEFT